MFGSDYYVYLQVENRDGLIKGTEKQEGICVMIMRDVIKLRVEMGFLV